MKTNKAITSLLFCLTVNYCSAQTLYTSSKDDPKYLAYLDSLFKWEYSQYQINLIKQMKDVNDYVEGAQVYRRILEYKRDNEYRYNPTLKKSNEPVKVEPARSGETFKNKGQLYFVYAKNENIISKSSSGHITTVVIGVSYSVCEPDYAVKPKQKVIYKAKAEVQKIKPKPFFIPVDYSAEVTGKKQIYLWMPSGAKMPVHSLVSQYGSTVMAQYIVN